MMPSAAPLADSDSMPAGIDLNPLITEPCGPGLGFAAVASTAPLNDPVAGLNENLLSESFSLQA